MYDVEEGAMYGVKCAIGIGQVGAASELRKVEAASIAKPSCNVSTASIM